MQKIVSIIFGVTIIITVIYGCTKEDTVEPTTTSDNTNNTGNNNPSTPLDTAYYANDVAPIMTNYCTSCHSGGAASAGLSLDNYSDVKAIAQSGMLVGRMNSPTAPMPPSGLVSQSKRDLIQDWIEGGYQP